MSERAGGNASNIADDELVFNEFARMARLHAKENGLIIVEYDPDIPYHRLDNAYFPVDQSDEAPKTAEEGIALMEEFQPNYRKVILEPLLKRRSALIATRDAYEEGRDTMVLSDHDSLSDIQKFTGSFPIALDLAGLVEYGEARENTETLIGRLVTPTAVMMAGGKLVLTPDLLRKLTAIRLLIPDTESVETSAIPEEVAKRANAVAIMPLLEKRPEGAKGRIIGNAGPGSVAKWVDGERVTKPIRGSAAKFIRALGRNVVVPMSGTLTGENPYCVVEEPERIRDINRPHELMILFAAIRQQRTGIPARYDDPR